MRISSYFVPLCTLALSACFTPYQTSFDCPVQNGVPCTSMTRINKMIDKGLLGKAEEDHSKENCGCESNGYEGDSEKKTIYITHFKPKTEPIITQEAPIEPMSSQLESQLSTDSSSLESTEVQKEQTSFTPPTIPSTNIEDKSTADQEIPKINEVETLNTIQPDMTADSLEPEVLEMPHNCQACTVTDEEINV